MGTKEMKKAWYDPENPAGYGGVSKLSKAVNQNAKKTKNWLKSQNAYTLNKPMRRRFPTRAYKTFGIDDLWQMDLMEMIPYSKINKGYKYILSCIDVFSRFARAIPIKSKSASEVNEAMKRMFANGHPDNLQTDLGKEFYNSKVKALLKLNGINHYTVHSQYKAALVERFHRTLRERLKRYFDAQGNKVWITVLPKIINSYNYSPHRGLNGLRPTDISNDNQLKIWLSREKKHVKVKPKYKVGDFVRISKISASRFIKNFDTNWSDEVFQISQINIKQVPVMYVIRDYENNVVQGKFYEQELQVINEPTTYRIQKVLKSKGVGKNKQYYVRWHGYKTPTWIPAKNLTKRTISI